MRRLTERKGDGIIVLGCKSIFPAIKRKGAYLSNAILRLAEYEDTGLTVERAAELGKADREGRVVIKPYCPVKVGDMVYTIRDNAAIGYRVTEISVGNEWMVISARRNDRRLSFGLLDIGKTVFLTREEAEKALEAEQGG